MSKNWTTSSLHAGRFTAACGVTVYRGNLLPKEYRGAAFTCDPTGNLVHGEFLTPDGASFRSRPDREGVEFLASPDDWFRPVNLAHGPEGALYVVDMYRAVIEHPEWIPDDWEAKLDLRAGHDKGRIYRVYPIGTKPRAIQKLAGLDSSELVEAMDSPNGPQRDLAMRLLLESRAQSERPGLEKLAKSAGRPQIRLQALATLNCLDALDDSLLLHALRDEHPEVRRWAAEHAGRRASASMSSTRGSAPSAVAVS